MTGVKRRAEIVRQIQAQAEPVSGQKLAAAYGGSRQVIVQDIALIRAAGYDIIATNRGYILNAPVAAKRTFKVQHSDDQLEEELCCIVDLGGCVQLNINSRKKIADFLEDIRSGKSSPLKNITSGYHYHEVTADNEETLDMVEHVLKEKGFLVAQESFD